MNPSNKDPRCLCCSKCHVCVYPTTQYYIHTCIYVIQLCGFVTKFSILQNTLYSVNFGTSITPGTQNVSFQES